MPMRSNVLLASLAALSILLGGCSDDPTIKVSERPADGLTAAAMDGAFLAALTEWTREAATARLQESYARNDLTGNAVDKVRVASRYLDVNGRRLALVEIAYRGTPVRVARVSGIEAGRLVTVSCTSPDGSDVAYENADSACGRVIRREFP